MKRNRDVGRDAAVTAASLAVIHRLSRPRGIGTTPPKRCSLVVCGLHRLQRIAQWHPVTVLDEAPFPIRHMHQAGQPFPRYRVVLDEHGQPQPGIQECGDDLAESVFPLPGLDVAEDSVGLDLGIGGLEHEGLAVLEVRIAECDYISALFVQRPQHWMPLPQEQPTAGPEQLSDDIRPAVDVRQPDERSPGFRSGTPRRRNGGYRAPPSPAELCLRRSTRAGSAPLSGL
jgi:hypothetical protein